VRLGIQSFEKMLIRAKKIQYEYQKTQNFMLISNPLKKFLKNVQKKVISNNVTEIHTFSTFTPSSPITGNN
jgi:hypothetical protein